MANEKAMVDPSQADRSREEQLLHTAMANEKDQPPALQEVMDRKKTKGGGNKRRFNDDQIRSLESMFEEEAKLEPGKMVRLAMDLGLQPRQVAVWFQNRRARWKSKKLESEYNILKANYVTLSASFESLMKEKQSLFKQLQRLKEQLGVVGKESGGSSRTAVPDLEWEEKPKVLVKKGGDQQLGGELLNGCGGMHEQKIMSSILERLGPEESDLMEFTDPINRSSITWPEEWGDVDSESFSDQSCATMEWWDVWS